MNTLPQSLLPARWDRKFFLKVVVTAIGYYALAQLSFLFATYPPDSGSTPIWLAAGFSVGILLIWGYELWVGVVLGDLITNFILFHAADNISSVIVTLLLGVVTIAGKIFAVYLIDRLIGQRYFLDRAKDVIQFIAFAAFLSPLPVGIPCALLMSLFGKSAWADYFTVALNWWLGDAFGILLLTSLMVALRHDARQLGTLLKQRGLEAAIVLFCVFVISQIAFGGGIPVEYILIPLVIWAAFRFKAAGTMLLVMLQVTIAVVGTAQGHGSFIRSSMNESLLLLQSFVAVLALTALIVSAVISENDHAKSALRHANATLEDKVLERTAELSSANEEILVLNDKLKTDNLRLGAELDVARQMQQLILPNTEELEIEGLDIAGYMEPADEVGGDYYDVLQTNGIVTLGIGDVTGHGLESGILMIMAQTAIRTLQETREADPVRFLDTLNRVLYKNVRRMNSEKSLTLALLNYADGRISISGQHEETIVVRKDGTIERIDTMDLGFPIALDDDIAAFISQLHIELAPGDGVVLYTDGIPEAYNMNKKQYGMEPMCDIISQNWDKSAEGIKEAIIADVLQFIGKQKVFDDITLLVLKRRSEVFGDRPSTEDFEAFDRPVDATQELLPL